MGFAIYEAMSPSLAREVGPGNLPNLFADESVFSLYSADPSLFQLDPKHHKIIIINIVLRVPFRK